MSFECCQTSLFPCIAHSLMSVMAYLLVNKITFYLWLAASIHRSFMFMLLSALARNMVHEIKYNKTDLFLDIGRYDTVWHCKIHTSVSYLPMSRRRSVLFYFISWSLILSNFSITAKGEKLSILTYFSVISAIKYILQCHIYLCQGKGQFCCTLFLKVSFYLTLASLPRGRNCPKPFG